jgi:hypothetical protein
LDVFLVAVAAVRTLWHAPSGKGLMLGFGTVAFGVFVIIAVVADQADVDGGEQCEDKGLNEADEQLQEVENE